MRVVNHNITNRLRQWREANGLTLADEEGLTGLSQPFLSRLERGERNLRPLDRVRIARALGCSVSDLFDPEFFPVDGTNSEPGT